MTNRSRDPDHDYFENVYAATSRSITLYLISKCKTFEDVNDILQEVYMEFYRTIMRKGTDYIKEEEAFLIHLCRKKISSYYSFWERIPQRVSLDGEEYEKDAALRAAQEDPGDEEIFRREMVQDVREILREQPAEIQKIFYLYYTMELKIPEIASLLGLSVQNVKNKLFRTRKRIRERMEDWR